MATAAEVSNATASSLGGGFRANAYASTSKVRVEAWAFSRVRRHPWVDDTLCLYDQIHRFRLYFSKLSRLLLVQGPDRLSKAGLTPCVILESRLGEVR